MSAHRPFSDDVSGSDEDDFLEAALEELEEQETLVHHGFVQGRVMPEIGRELDVDVEERAMVASVAGHFGRPRARPRGEGGSTTLPMFEALEALATETEGHVPPSLDGHLEHLDAGTGLPLSTFVPPSGTTRLFQQVYQYIQVTESMDRQTQGLLDLCETLALATEETLAVSGFKVDTFVPAVVTLIRRPSSMDVLLLAARALSTMLELFPSTAIQKATVEQVIPSLCKKLLEIQYMDVAELALQILEKIVCKAESALTAANTAAPKVQRLCAQYRMEVIQENGIVALLQFIDFFPLDIQRRAARIVCQLCTDFPLSMKDKIRQGLPYITNLLRSVDTELLQSSFACLQKLGESSVFLQHEEFASMIATEEICGLLISKLTSYASLGESDGSSASSQVSPEGYTSMVRFLSCLLSCVSSDMSASSVIPSASHLRFVKLPSIVTALLAKQEVISENQLLRETLKLVIVVLPISKENFSTDVIPPAMLKSAHDILTLITCVYDVTSRSDLQYDCLDIIYRSCLLIHASQQAFTVQECTELSRLAAFLARVLRPKCNDMTVSLPAKADKDLVPIQLALKIVEVPLQHASAREAAMDIFERHGVASIIRFYASSLEHKCISGSGLQEIQDFSVRLVRNYLGDKSSVISEMAQLERLVDELQMTLVSSSAAENGQTASLVNVLLKLGDFVAQGDNFLTAHEIACSGLVKMLIRILSVDKGQQAFSQMQEMQSAESDKLGFVSSLLRCLQEAISSEKEAFSVSASDGWSVGLSSGSIATDLDRLTQHIKVHVLIEEAKLSTEPDSEDQSNQQADSHDQQESEEHSMKKAMSNKKKESNYHSNKCTVHETVVLVEPLATIGTMEDFVADKLFSRGEDAGGVLDELEGIGAEREEGGDVSESGEFSNDVMKLRRVIAVYNGQVLPPDISVLEAIVKFGDVDAKGNGKLDVDCAKSVSGSLSASGSPVWIAASHDITFRVAASPEMIEDIFIVEPTSMDSKISVAFSSSPASAKSFVLKPWWDDVWELLLLLKLVRNQCIENVSGTQLTFVNSYLSLQVRRALQQPVRLVTNSLPKWCFTLVNEFSFVLDFETRCHFMYATTCGCSRAIQYLCRSLWRKAVMEEPTPVRHVRLSNASGRRRHRDGSSRARTSGLDNISQMVKLPRLKVRVARSRLLQSAMKLVALYGGKKAVIEIEFLGEVGTGLGPTTEFFTLVCQQIQSKQLQLWRDDDRAVSELMRSAYEEEKRKTLGDDIDHTKTDQSNGNLAIRGYHRVAVYHCSTCKALHIPTCSVHSQLLTHEKKVADTKKGSTREDDSSQADGKSSSLARQQASINSIPQCVQCLDDRDWHSAAAFCDCKPNNDAASKCEESDSITNSILGYTLKWWILSDEEAQYLAKVFPRHAKRVNHPVLQCAHCDTVNFPGTDAGIVVMDGDRMISRTGRRMFERDYRAVTKHVSPLCEGTPLNVMTSAITRTEVDKLVTNLAQSPEVLESEVESLNYLSEATLAGGNLGGGPPVTAPFGLYPKPYLSDCELDEGKTSVKPNESSSVAIATLEADASDEMDVLTWFRFLGRFVGQAMLDERLLNLPFARPFVRALRDEKMVGSGVSVETSLSFVNEMDPSIANSLRYLYNLAVKYAAKETSGDVESEDVVAWTNEVDSLCLSFTMAGADNIPLEAGGHEISVTLPTLHRYVVLNLEFLLDRTIKSQVQAFRQGFEQICGGSGNRHLFHFLQAFDVRELESLLSDRGSGNTMWDRDGIDLREHMVCDHGYTGDSRAIANLVSILCELSIDEQRLFVRFVTGANRLPLGGLRKLEPKLTVVRKLTEVNDANSAEENDAVLPSASTCTNYLKLPEYSTRETMKQRLLYCITEGQCSFHLS